MDIMVRIPDDLARRLGTADEVERRALEALAIEEYRLGHLTETDVRRLLGFETACRLSASAKPSASTPEPRAQWHSCRSRNPTAAQCVRVQRFSAGSCHRRRAAPVSRGHWA